MDVRRLRLTQQNLKFGCSYRVAHHTLRVRSGVAVGTEKIEIGTGIYNDE